MKPKAILFDVDGTILDTHEYIYQAFEHSLDTHHKALSREEMQLVMGKPLVECYQILTSIEDVEHFINAHREFQMDNLHLATPFPNSLSTLEKLRKQGLLIAAVSSRAKDTVQETLEMTELIDYLNYVVGFEDVTEPKPSPEGINKVLNYLGIDSSEAIMVGDSDVDVFAGKNAGVRTVGVTYGFHGERIIEAEPDFIIDDIEEVLELIKD